MKLKLKHLIDAYKYQDEIIGSCDSWRIAKISDEIVYLSNGIHENQVLFSNFQIDYKIVKRPLSDLTKEIEVNVEKFVPIGKLLDAETKHNWSNSDYLEYESGQNEWWVKLKGKEPSYIFGYNSIMGFYALNQFSEKQFIRNQIELYEKLYEWHFDIHGLIENGLAIDINTLNNEI